MVMAMVKVVVMNMNKQIINTQGKADGYGYIRGTGSGYGKADGYGNRKGYGDNGDCYCEGKGDGYGYDSGNGLGLGRAQGSGWPNGSKLNKPISLIKL